MSQEQRKEEIMKEMEALEKPLRTVKDRLINLGKYKTYALEQTFGKDAAPRRTTRNLVAFYDTLVKSFDLDLQEEERALLEACRSLDGELAMVLKEVEEREEFHQMLEKHFKVEKEELSPLLKDARFHFEGQTRLFDEIIVTPGGVVFVDLKNPRHHVSIDSKGDYIEFDYRDARIDRYSILEIQERGKAILQGNLHNFDFDNIPILPIVLFTGKMDYANLCDKVTTMNVSQFEKYMDELSSETILNEKQLQKICVYLKLYSAQSKPIEYHFDTDFIEAYAGIRSKIEARLEN